MTEGESWYGVFLQAVRDGFSGGTIRRESKIFTFSPRLVQPYDFLRRREGRDDFERYLDSIDERFFEVARSEMYRRERGWIDRAVGSGEIRRVRVGELEALVPRLSTSASVGIDSSSIGNHWRIFGLFAIPDEASAYGYLEKHLGLPKTHNHGEIRWSKLNPEKRGSVIARFEQCIGVCCQAALLINTDVLTGAKSQIRDRIANLVDGCFGGYEKTDAQNRKSLRKRFFEMMNGAPVHCDPDFSPLPPGEVVRVILKRLSKQDGEFAECTPLVAQLHSHESRPIQIADVLVGAIGRLLGERKSILPLRRLRFDPRRIRSYPKTRAECYYFVE
jgi:hypothetical protein